MNAKQEFLDGIKDKPNVKCAYISLGDPYFTKYPSKHILKENYTLSELNNFLSGLDLNYDDDFGSQELFGTVWFVDGSWLERSEYDGAKSWAYKTTPEIPKELK